MITSLLQGLRAPPKDACVAMAQAFSDRLRQWSRIRRSTARGERVGVLVAPWLETAVPYYSLEWALRLDNTGLEVEVLWYSENLTGRTPSSEEQAIRQTLQRLPRQIVVRNVAKTTSFNFDLDCSLLEKLLFENETRSLGRDRMSQYLRPIPPIERSFFMQSVCWIV